MKIISHRGFCDGIDKSIENKPSEIESRISEGFDVEVDLWVKILNYGWDTMRELMKLILIGF